MADQYLGPQYSGSDGGEGNPPGQYSNGYLDSTESGGHFVTTNSYTGSMDVGRPATATVVGNQPKDSGSATLEVRANREDPFSLSE